MGGEDGGRPEVNCEDFLLKSQVLELLEAIRQLREGYIRVVEIKHGLPFSIEIELAASTTGIPDGGHHA